MKNPEMTPNQKELLDIMWDTTIQAKVILIRTVNGEPQFFTEERQMRPIDFKRPNEEGFAFKHHEQNPHAPPSPTYVNLRNLPQWLVRRIADEIAHPPLPNLNPPTRFSTGIPEAGVVLGQAYADITRNKYVPILAKISLDNNQRRIVAAVQAPPASGYPKSLMIVDDLITEGNSKLEAIQAAESLGYFVTGVSILIDRQQGGKRFLDKIGYKVYTAMTFMQAVGYFRDTKKITEQQFQQAVHYQKLAA